jgi:hypothetical protein
MSLGNKEYGKIIDINSGQFNQRLSEGEDAPTGTSLTVRELTAGPNKGKEVREARANALPNNLIVNAEMSESQYGTNLILGLIDEDDQKYDLQIKVNSQFFGQFVKRIPNLDIKAPVTFILGASDGKAFMYLQQDGKTVKSAYTKDNPNGMPPPTQRANGQWNWDDQEDFLYEKCKLFIEEVNAENDVVKKEIPF